MNNNDGSKQHEVRTPHTYPVETGDYGVQVGGILGTVITAIGAVLVLRRRASKDGLEVARDRAETNVMDTVIAERDRAMNEAREAWAKRTADAQAIAELSLQVKHLTEQNALLEAQITRLTKLVLQFAPAEMQEVLRGVHNLGENT